MSASRTTVVRKRTTGGNANYTNTLAEFGVQVARIRESRNMNRVKLSHRLRDEMDEDDPNYTKVSELWIARLEQGKRIHLPRQTLEALLRALDCSVRERIVLLHYSGCTIFNTSDPINDVVFTLSFAMDTLYQEAGDYLSTLLNQRKATSLDRLELLEIVGETINLFLDREKHYTRHRAMKLRA